MIISLDWLRSYLTLPTDFSTDLLSDTLTDLGLEVEGVETVERVQGGLQGVVVGEVLTCERHPNADKLSVCTVSVGSSDAPPLPIVCGAPNVAAGQKVLVATIGTTLYPVSGEPLTIKKGKIRGAESHGMICAEDELGLGESHDGILVLPPDTPVGIPAAQALNLASDTVLHIGLTPNRTDAMSHHGVARDLAARLGVPYALEPALSTLRQQLVLAGACPVRLSVEAPAHCPRYAGCVLTGVKVAPSPDWLRHRLEAVGQRSINNIVDATNYILLGLGQPLHAFDADLLAGSTIRVRLAAEGEQLETLDDKVRTLNPAGDLVIADADKPACLAGIMGGKHSGVTEATTSIFLESACFDADTIRRTARRLGLTSPSAYRFERGVDPTPVREYLLLAAALIQHLAGGTVSEVVEAIHTDLAPKTATFSIPRANRLIGVSFEVSTYRQILESLDIRFVRPHTPDETEWEVSIPRYRVDVNAQQDLVEEFLRVYGINRLPMPTHTRVPLAAVGANKAWHLRDRLAEWLTAAGFAEHRTNSLLPRRHQSEGTVPMFNPLSEENAILRDSLVHSLLEVAAYNSNRQQTVLAGYEFGRTYHAVPEGHYTEREWLALYRTGYTHEPAWNAPSQPVTFFDLKRDAWQVVRWLQLSAIDRAADDHEAQFPFAYQRIISVGKRIVGRYGQLAPALARPYGIKDPVYYAEFDWTTLLALLGLGETAKPGRRTPYQEIPKYPHADRDISMLVSPEVRYEDIVQTITQTHKKLIQSVRLFDVYHDPKTNQTSYALTIRFLDTDKTLDEPTLTKAFSRVLDRLDQLPGVKVRRE
jgi:phenylalanyl-tRNA synthetase beta chain